MAHISTGQAVPQLHASSSSSELMGWNREESVQQIDQGWDMDESVHKNTGQTSQVVDPGQRVAEKAAFEQVRQQFAASATKLGVSPVELLRALSVPEFARINSTSTWNAYQVYFKDNREAELRRTFGTTTNIELTPQNIKSCFTSFKLAYPAPLWCDIVLKAKLVSEGQMTTTSGTKRSNHFNKSGKRIMDMVSPEDGLKFTYFFETRFKLPDGEAVNHLHIYALNKSMQEAVDSDLPCVNAEANQNSMDLQAGGMDPTVTTAENISTAEIRMTTPAAEGGVDTPQEFRARSLDPGCQPSKLKPPNKSALASAVRDAWARKYEGRQWISKGKVNLALHNLVDTMARRMGVRAIQWPRDADMPPMGAARIGKPSKSGISELNKRSLASLLRALTDPVVEHQLIFIPIDDAFLDFQGAIITDGDRKCMWPENAAEAPDTAGPELAAAGQKRKRKIGQEDYDMSLNQHPKHPYIPHSSIPVAADPLFDPYPGPADLPDSQSLEFLSSPEQLQLLLASGGLTGHADDPQADPRPSYAPLSGFPFTSFNPSSARLQPAQQLQPQDVEPQIQSWRHSSADYYDNTMQVSELFKGAGGIGGQETRRFLCSSVIDIARDTPAAHTLPVHIEVHEVIPDMLLTRPMMVIGLSRGVGKEHIVLDNRSSFVLKKTPTLPEEPSRYGTSGLAREDCGLELGPELAKCRQRSCSSEDDR
ncbi:hypothetical protein FIBSPDRAFT_899933 [Athelia psychrophila]|uniref:Uncharacterized protein n=1 Tax=Athelia psychrophila TaxID=1759441 RepID=A0A165Z206_9AGAM|nr:hypothetical protein FIBSPDRAFT_899933 [Fibularhizoctonia sp. CBS 109695]